MCVCGDAIPCDAEYSPLSLSTYFVLLFPCVCSTSGYLFLNSIFHYLHLPRKYSYAPFCSGQGLFNQGERTRTHSHLHVMAPSLTPSDLTERLEHRILEQSSFLSLTLLLSFSELSSFYACASLRTLVYLLAKKGMHTFAGICCNYYFY